jgi:hypothetical protein
MLPVLVVKEKMNIINNLVKKPMLTKSPPTSHNSLKIIIQKMLLKTFFMSICVTTQLRCKSSRALMPKGMVPQG